MGRDRLITQFCGLDQSNNSVTNMMKQKARVQYLYTRMSSKNVSIDHIIRLGTVLLASGVLIRTDAHLRPSSGGSPSVVSAGSGRLKETTARKSSNTWTRHAHTVCRVV